MRKNYSLILFFIGLAANSQIINITDEAFKNQLTVQSTVYGWAKNEFGQTIIVDSNNDGEIEVSEALEVYSLYVGHPNIHNLAGIEYFTNLRTLRCDSNYITHLNLTTLIHLEKLECQYNDLVELNITGLSELEILYCNNNDLTQIDFTGCTSLSLLWCFENQLSSINVSNLVNLRDFRCRDNQLSSLNVSNLSNLLHLECDRNNLTNLNVAGANINYLTCSHNLLASLNISDLHNLTNLTFGYNPISAIDLTGLPLINWFDLSGTQFSTMDFSQIPMLHELICNNCSLATIDVGNNHEIGEIVSQNSPNLESVFMKNGRFNALYASGSTLKYVCADDDEIEYMSSTNTDLSEISINSYCSFTPGGDFYTIQGEARYDEDNNGCDNSDLIFPNLKLNITDGTVSGTIISDETANYSIPVQAGTHTVSPVLEYPTYFSVSPTDFAVTFPVETSPAIHNFCISPNSVHNDLEITIVPTTIARPGFDANYKIIFKNNGTHTQSGMVNFVFDDALIDFVNSNPVADSQSSGMIEWNFVNLHPFETKEILLTLNLNSPVEVPALIGGEVLDYSAAITALADETPQDNTSQLHQLVVNSLDPNAKICLEGAAIGPDKVGDYVHYLIYFENSGTAAAENVVVKDVLDETKFDISSLRPLDGSHSFTTRINGNKVEFIFEDINLPFDDAHNDGYVAFKIKTLPDLLVDSSFSNSASIYFDYNLPVVTDAANTMITALSNEDPEFSNYISLYPNPAENTLNLQKKIDIQIHKINIYNVLGQLVLGVQNAGQTSGIDVSKLTSGTYFIKIDSDKGTIGSKFIKQ